MKKLLLVLPALLLAFSGAAVRAQSSPSPIPTWAQSYGVGAYDDKGQPIDDPQYGSGSDYPTAVAPMPDGGMVVGGQLSLNKLTQPGSNVGSYCGALIRYGASGRILWQQLLRQNNDNISNNELHIAVSKIVRVRTDAAGNIFVAGLKYDSTGRSPIAFVAKFAADGALIWQNSFTDSATEKAFVSEDGGGAALTMDLLSDGGVILGASIYYYVGNNQARAPFLAKFNADGSLGFQREYETSYSSSTGFNAMCRRPDADGYAVILTHVEAGGYVNVLILTDAVGAPVYQRALNNSAYGGAPTYISTNPDGGYFLVGALAQNNGDGVEVRKLKADLTPVWQKLFHHFGGNGVALTPTRDGGCLLSGTYSRDSVDAILLTVDRNGSLTAAHVLGGPRDEGFAYGCLTADGGFGLATSTISYATAPGQKPDWWVVKADANGKVAGFADNMFDVPLANFGGEESDEKPSFAPEPYGPGTVRHLASTPEPRFVPEDLDTEIGINKPTIKTQTTTPIPPPVHGGLSGISFTVDESFDPTPFSADTVLRFRATQSGTPAGLSVRVQSSTDNGGTWTDLTDATGGRMIYAPRQSAYVLNSTSYPTVGNVYFRAVAQGPAYGEKPSAAVGPFDLSSTKAHLGAPLLFVTTNGDVNAIRFGVKQKDLPSGVGVRIQTSQTPADEASWVNAPIGTGGQMAQDTATPDLNQFYLGTDEYPSGEGIYFRAIASASGYVDSLSYAYGPFTFVRDPAATVSITVNGVAFPDGNDIDSGGVLPTGAFNMKATATSGRLIKRLTLLYDGVMIGHFDDGATSGALDYKSNIPGDHIIEAYATDDLGVTGAAPPVHVRVLPASPGRVFTAVNSGTWNDPATWSVAGDPGVPGANDFAIVSTYSPKLTGDTTVNAMSLNGGTISGAYTLTVNAFCTIAGGNIRTNLTIPSGSTCEFLNDDDIGLTGLLSYAGTIRLHGKGGITGIKTGTAQSGALHLSGGENPDGFFDGLLGAIQGVGRFFADLASGGRRGSRGKAPAPKPQPAPEVRPIQVAKANIAGGLLSAVPPPSKLISNDGSGLVAAGAGNVVNTDMSKLIAAGAGNAVAKGANLVAAGAGNLQTLIAAGAGNLIAAGAGNVVATGQGNLVAAGAGNLIAAGAGNFTGPKGASKSSYGTAASTEEAFVQTGGETDLTNISISGAVSLNGGTLSGSGLIFGDLTNNGGFISPGHSPGAIGVVGNFAQGSGGTLVLENGGRFADQFDSLQVTGAASLGGKVDVKLINGYTPDPADTFNPLGYSSVTGSFASVSGNAAVSVNPTGLITTVDPAKPNPKSGQPVNIATRLAVRTGDNALFAGFFVTGPAGSTKKVLIRGLGPSVPVPGTLPDPLLELHNPDGSTVVNDNWRDGDTSQIPAGFSPSNDNESALVATLTVGSAGYSGYTAIMKGAHGETGVGLVEVYDLDTGGAAQLANIATRGLVQTGDNVLIGGFIVQGSEPAKMLVRATGPSSGVPGALADPVLEVHDSNGSVISNDNWRETQEAEITATGIAPKDDREPAVLSTLVPGNYTAVVRGANDTTGVAVVEAYNLQ